MKTSWRCLEDVFARGLEDVFKTYGQDEYIGLDQKVLKTSWRSKAKVNIFVLIKTSSEDDDKTSSIVLVMKGESGTETVNYDTKLMHQFEPQV